MKHIPNILSCFRIVLIPFFIWQVVAGNMLSAAVILIVSAVTDMLDGFLARRFNWVTQLGKFLDPAADKLTQVTVCVVLAITLRSYGIFFALLMLVELVMLIFGGWLLKKGVKLHGARWFGKVVTVLFYVTMVLLVFIPNMPMMVARVLLGVTVACAVAAALMYIPEFVRHRRELKEDRRDHTEESV